MSSKRLSVRSWLSDSVRSSQLGGRYRRGPTEKSVSVSRRSGESTAGAPQGVDEVGQVTRPVVRPALVEALGSGRPPYSCPRRQAPVQTSEVYPLRGARLEE